MAKSGYAGRVCGRAVKVALSLAVCGWLALLMNGAVAQAQGEYLAAGEPFVAPRALGRLERASSGGGQAWAEAIGSMRALAADAGSPSPQVVVPPPARAGDKVIYLTFDDGPSPSWTRQVLNVLARYHAQATFFVVGEQAQAHPELIRAISAAGHALGNHTYDHAWLGRLSAGAIRGELLHTQAVLGARASDCMRPPYGSTSRQTRSTAAREGLAVVLWDVDPRDWSRPGANRIASFILKHAYPGATVLLHDGGGNRAQTVAALASVLQGLSRRGYRFATLPACRRAGD